MCKENLGWENLSKDTVIMDVGCGVHFKCCKEIIEQFPDVERVIALDKKDMSHVSLGKVQIVCANIEEWDSVRKLEEKINIIVSRNALQQVQDIEMPLKNMYRMLKPGGNIGITYYINSIVDTWMKKIASVAKWKKYRVINVIAFFPGSLETKYYKEMMKRIGFQDVRPEMRDIITSYDTDDSRKKLFSITKKYFCIPPELMHEFEQESMIILDQVIDKDENGSMEYKCREIHLFAVKPSISCTS